MHHSGFLKRLSSKKFDWLYQASARAQQAAISPVTPFNAMSASTGNAWEGLVSPGDARVKKSLVIDASCLQDDINHGELAHIIRQLQLAGFSVYLCYSNTPYQDCIQKVADFPSVMNARLLKQLRRFNPKTDYSLLVEQQVARDSVGVFNRKRMKSVHTALANESLTFHDGYYLVRGGGELKLHANAYMPYKLWQGLRETEDVELWVKDNPISVRQRGFLKKCLEIAPQHARVFYKGYCEEHFRGAFKTHASVIDLWDSIPEDFAEEFFLRYSGIYGYL